MPKTKTRTFYYGRPREVKIFEPRVGRMWMEMDLCQAENFARRKRHKDNQAFSKVMGCRRRMPNVGTLSRDVEKKML